MFLEGQQPRLDTTLRYPDLLRELGKRCESEWSSAATDEVKRVKGMLTEPQHFGEIPSARQFGTVYRAAHHVYTATLEGLRDDLEAAGAALRAAADSMKDSDEASADDFQRLGNSWGNGQGMDSSSRHDEASRDDQVREGAQAKDELEGDAAGDTPAANDTTMTTPGDSPGDGGSTSDPGMTTGG